MKRRKVKGFTLIELIVVIAIIGVLASILIPTMMGYVKKSKRAADVSTARETYVKVIDLMTGEYEGASDSFYSGGSVVFQKHDDLTDKDYNIVLVTYLDGLNSTDGSGKVWTPVDNDQQSFCDTLNSVMEITPSSGMSKMKIKTKDSTIGTLNRWYIGYREADPQTIEVWIGDGNRGGGCGEPLLCLYTQINKSNTSST